MEKLESAIKTIRLHCLECCCGSSQEVSLCPVTKCRLYLWRFGVDPRREKVKKVLTDEQRKAIGEKLQRGRERLANKV